MTEARARTQRRLAAVALQATLVLAGLTLTACESVMPPRALGAGEVVVVTYPSDSLAPGDLAVFAVRLNLPDDRYRIGLTVDPAGLDAEDDVTADDGALLDVTLSEQDGITVEQARSGDRTERSTATISPSPPASSSRASRPRVSRADGG